MKSIAIMLALYLTASPASAFASQPTKGGGANESGPDIKVKFAGCPVAGIEGGCVVVQSDGQLYELTSEPKPSIEKGLGISGTGTWQQDTVGYCMQGKALVNIKWVYTKQKCAVPRAKKE